MPEPTVSSFSSAVWRIGTRCSLTSSGCSITTSWQGASACANLLRRQRLRQRARELLGALLVVRPAEHGVDDLDVAEQVGEHLVVRLALDVVEEDRAAAIHQLLQAGDFEIGIDLLVGLDQIAARLEPGERAAQVLQMLLRAGRGRHGLGADIIHSFPSCSAGLLVIVSAKMPVPPWRRASLMPRGSEPGCVSSIIRMWPTATR